MIEGLRLFPWLQEAAKRAPETVSFLLNCSECRKHLSKERRQLMMACGYEEPVEGVKPNWCHPGYQGPRPTICAGYTTKLPAVRERTWHRYWKHLLPERLGAAPSEDDFHEIETLDAETNAAEL